MEKLKALQYIFFLVFNDFTIFNRNGHDDITGSFSLPKPVLIFDLIADKNDLIK